MNILAPTWVTSMYKLLPCYDSYTSTERLHKSLSYLSKLSCDVYCLSEVEESNMPAIIQFFGPEWDTLYVSHDNGFWREWLEGKEWVSNGTCIISNRNIVGNIRPSSLRLGDGCNASHILCMIQGRIVSLASVHFDTSDKKWTEAKQLLHHLQKTRCDVSIISGDFNFTDVSTFEDLGYMECAREGHSTPLCQGMIDHTLVLGARRVSGYIDRLGDACSTVHVNGSDHYATISTIQV